MHNSRTLLYRPADTASAGGVISSLSPATAGWDELYFEARRFEKGQEWQHSTEDSEMAIVLLGGKCHLESDRGSWPEIGGRQNVFDGMPFAIYLPRRTSFRLTAASQNLELACAWVATEQDHPARLVRPADSQIEIRGGHNATRQINSIFPPGFDCHKLVCVEVYTPGGNWSSYPPHKHDRHLIAADGTVSEADLEEIYFYKFKQPGGFAFQRVYNDSRLLDQAIVAQENDIVIVPEGYHPVAAAHGFDCYYLNFLAGSEQSLAATYDPEFDWVRATWSEPDPRLPIVSHKMEEKVPA